MKIEDVAMQYYEFSLSGYLRDGVVPHYLTISERPMVKSVRLKHASSRHAFLYGAGMAVRHAEDVQWIVTSVQERVYDKAEERHLPAIVVIASSDKQAVCFHANAQDGKILRYPLVEMESNPHHPFWDGYAIREPSKLLQQDKHGKIQRIRLGYVNDGDDLTIASVVRETGCVEPYRLWGKTPYQRLYNLFDHQNEIDSTHEAFDESVRAIDDELRLTAQL